nr:hypothetical protein [Heliobacterium chlorum]
MYRILDPVVQREAEKQHQFTSIPKDDYVSNFMESLWRAAKEYNGDSHFMQRFYHLMEQASFKLERYYQSKKRDIQRTTSLDQPSGDENNSLYEVLPDTFIFEEYVTTQDEIKKSLDGFRTTNERDSKVIDMLQFGCTNSEIAESLGGRYSEDRIRKRVQRARDRFKEFLESAA